MLALLPAAVAALLLPASAHANSGLPFYLFLDWRFWLFSILYILATMRLAVWIKRAADIRDASQPYPLKHVSWTATCLLFAAIVYQTVHHAEHVAQIFQYWYLGQHKSVSRGIVFFLDLEWNHFIFDSLLFLLLIPVCWLYLRSWKAAGLKPHPFTRRLMAAVLIIQGWHAVEHTYRIIRHVNEGCEPCAGIADQVFDIPLIPLHFWFNVFALTVPLLLFYWLRMDRFAYAFLASLKRRLRSFFAQPTLPELESER